MVAALKRRNPRFGNRRIALSIARTSFAEIDKDVDRRVLANYYRLWPGSGGPCWLTVTGNMRDSIWSIERFRCESITLKTHRILVLMDQFTRRIISFGVHMGTVDAIARCRIFNRAITTQGAPCTLSSAKNLLFEVHRWNANLRVIEVDELKPVPHTLTSRPFLERLIGTIR
jgi:hypothetical protein